MTRKEYDSLGELELDENLLYGIQTYRGRSNFVITGEIVNIRFIKALSMFKKATILANHKANLITKDQLKPMLQACDEIIDGKHNDQFVTDSIQGGAGTSINMNINEVIANRAAEIFNTKKGEYIFVNPNDHVNMGQSTNDAIPTAAKIALIKMIDELLLEIEGLRKSLLVKADEFKEIIKCGRTHLQDAVPISLGQEFGAWANSLKRDIRRLQQLQEELKEVNAGGTAVGTGITADKIYFDCIGKFLEETTNIKGIRQADDMIDNTRHLDSFVMLSSILKALAVNLSKNCNDLRLMASGPTTGLQEINLPQVQPGSSIMPGKVNPVIPETVNQTCFEVFGNDLTITKAAEAGQFELNVFEPVLLRQLFESISILTNSIKTLNNKAIKDMTANKDRCDDILNKSLGLVTSLSPHIGYKNASIIAKQVIKTGVDMKQLVLEKKLLTEEQYNKIVDPKSMLAPGVVNIKK